MKTNTTTEELERCKRTIQGIELRNATLTHRRLNMAELGVSSTNLVFDSELAEERLSPEIIEILKDDPTTDSGIMHTRVPTTEQTSSITHGSISGFKPIELTADDDDQYAFMSGFDTSDLDHLRNGTDQVIERLPFFIHDLACWCHGFNPVKYQRSLHKRSHKAMLACIPEANITKRGKITTRRKRPTKRSYSRRRRVSVATHTVGV